MSKDKLLADGMSIPPFHGRCRCVLVASESASVASESVESFSGALGALNDSNDPNGDRREAHANLYYEELRNRRDREAIVRKLSEHSGVSLKSARKVFEHVFIKKYDLGDGILRHFDPSYDMAESFRRLLEGKSIQEHDIILVRHERLEHELMNRYGKDSRTAHKLTCRKYDYQTALNIWLRGRENHGGH